MFPTSNRRADEPGADLGRREFLGGLLAAGGVAAVMGANTVAAPPGPATASAAGTGPATATTTRPAAGLLDSPPVLQNPSPTGVTVVWAVSAPATGWVEYGDDPARLDRRADLPAFGLAPVGGRFLAARIDGLTPGRPVHYRVVARAVTYRSAYKIELGEPVAGPAYRFVPPDPAADGASFAVLNDTHEQTATLAALFRALGERPATDFTVWNGDVFNDVRSDDQVVAQVLRPAGVAYAAERPVLFTSGNHDVRGAAARGLSAAVAPWAAEGPLGRCFTLRHGPLAVVGLDTGEDKPDHHPAWAGLARFEPYRQQQAAWLEQALARPEVASAPFLVAFCHIPLWGLPGDNPGDTLDGYADYCRHAQRLWHPHLAKAGVQLLVCGHTHRHRYDPPAEGRPYGQLVGGGPKPEQATILRGVTNGRQLEVVAEALAGRELGRWTFAPRRV